MLPRCLQCTPKSLWKELCSQNEGLEELINMQIYPFSQGILILSRSWAVDLNLKEKQAVICDALLIAWNSSPHSLHHSQGAGCRWAVLLHQHHLHSEAEAGEHGGLLWKCVCHYQGPPPESWEQCGVLSECSIPDWLPQVLLHCKHSANGSFVAVPCDCLAWLQIFLEWPAWLWGFKSAHSQAIWDLLKKPPQEQRVVYPWLTWLREDNHGHEDHGEDQDRNMFHCETNEILYICENQPLRKFIR